MAQVPTRPSPWRPLASIFAAVCTSFAAAFIATGLREKPISISFVVIGAVLLLFGAALGITTLTWWADYLTWRKESRAAREQNDRLLVQLEERCENNLYDAATMNAANELADSQSEAHVRRGREIFLQFISPGNEEQYDNSVDQVVDKLILSPPIDLIPLLSAIERIATTKCDPSQEQRRMRRRDGLLSVLRRTTDRSANLSTLIPEESVAACEKFLEGSVEPLWREAMIKDVKTLRASLTARQSLTLRKPLPK